MVDFREMVITSFIKVSRRLTPTRVEKMGAKAKAPRIGCGAPPRSFESGR